AREDEISVLDGEDHWHGCAGLSSAEILPQLVDALVAHGVDDICWFDLTAEAYPFSVVRVIVPGLEHVGHEGSAELGVEAIDAIMRAAERMK
ncbi:MAG: YcaO-like family protein, partial [Pseudomonadota bacterium]